MLVTNSLKLCDSIEIFGTSSGLLCPDELFQAQA